VKPRGLFIKNQAELLQRISRAGGVFVVGWSVVALIGWLLSIDILIRILPNAVAINPITAVAFLCLGVALWERSGNAPQRSGWRGRLPWVLAAIVALIGAMKLMQCSTGWNFHIDRLLFASRLGASGMLPASEMAPNTAIDFVLCGIALIMMDVELKDGSRPAQGLTLIAGLIALLALIGYSYSVLVLYRLRGAIPMAFGTAINFSIFCLSFLAARPQSGLMKVITSPTTGGAVARRLLPMAILVPWILGGILLAAEQKAYFYTDWAISIFAVASIFIFTGLVWWNAKLLYRNDLARTSAERRLAAQHGVTRVLADSSNLSQAAPLVLQRVSEMLGWQAGAMWIVDGAGKDLKCAEFWSASPDQTRDFAEASRAARITPNEGLPGRVWAGREPIWVDDVAGDQNFARRKPAAEASLHSAFAFPIVLGSKIFGVMEFFSEAVQKEDRALMEIAAAMGGQIGQFIERTRAEESLQKASGNLTRSNAELQQFAYIASHDLNEPLRMITSYLQLVEERWKSKLDPQAQEFIGFALDGAQRMRALIADLLAYSRLEAKAAPFETVDCEQVFQTAVQNLKIAIQENNAAIHHEPLPKVRGDPVQITQVFQNLIGNALKFHGTASPEVRVGATRKDGEWIFFVRDNGIGIDPKHFERIFIIFQRLHTRQQYSGTGMGLAICKRIVERHGGRIWVESEPGEGATFFFTLPVMRG
jgi:signal transduction histidine kinase